ncbi:MAG: hypothetical protein AAF743_00175 [Planctomycetota bacterium]
MSRRTFEAVVGDDRQLQLPTDDFPPGTKVLVIELEASDSHPEDATSPTDSDRGDKAKYPLRGTEIWIADDAFDRPAVDPEDWDALR